MRTLILLGLVLMALAPLQAQETILPERNQRSWDVYVQGRPGQTKLIFMDILTGERVAFNTRGERYTLLEGWVMYFDIEARQVKMARPGEPIRQHPFIIVSPDDYRVDWAVSADRKFIAWTLARRNAEEALTTSTFVADAAGSDIREVLADGPREGLRVLPIALADDQTELYMDVHPDGLNPTPYTQYASLFALHLATGEIRNLPGEPACFLCAAGFGEGLFARLTSDGQSLGVEVRLDSLHGGAARVIPAIRQDHAVQAGDVLISPDGGLAVYALSQVDANQAVRTVLARVDLHKLEQSILGRPMAGFVYPIAWAEDSGAILLTNEQRSGTWKIDLNAGRLVKIATATYLGHLG